MMKRRQEDRSLHVVVPAPQTTGKTADGIEAGKYEVEPHTGILRSAPAGSIARETEAVLTRVRAA